MTFALFEPPWPKKDRKQQKWRNNLAQDQRLVIEIGAGVGWHPIAYAKNHSNDYVICIERTRLKAAKLFNRVLKHPEITNVYPVRADAIPWIWKNISKSEVSHYFILYPNPYPKSSQANKRFFNMPFMHYLLETLKPGGKITLATNSLTYIKEAYVRSLVDWKLDVCAVKTIGKGNCFRTHFEKKYVAKGQICYDLTLLKQS